MAYRVRYPIGDYVWEHLTEAERKALLRFMRAADGSNDFDDGYCALGNAGIGIHVEPGKQITVRQARLLLERMAYARLLDWSTEVSGWRRILRNATETDESFARLARLYEIASGVDDEEAFDPDDRWVMMEEWKRQADRLPLFGLFGSGWLEVRPSPVRPALVRYALEGGPLPILEEDEQMALDLPAEAGG